MKIETYENCSLKKGYEKLNAFLYNLSYYIPLDYLDVNDWESNTRPAVYIHNRKNMFNMKKYSRCNKYDVVNALKFYYN